jgi:hypothetical protein
VKEMRRTILLIRLMLVCGCAVLAQTQETRARTAGSNDTSATASQANKSVNIQSGTHVAGQLQNTLDARKAKVGDQVVLKTTHAIKSDGHIVANKGARLLGHVTSVEQQTSANGQSQIGLLFDRLESNSLAVPITATISSITQTATHAQAGNDDVFGSDTSTMTSSRSTATTQRSGAQGGGGLLGGVTKAAGGVVNTTTSAVGGVAGGATSAVGSTVHSTTSAAGQTTAGVGSLGGIQITESSSTSAQGGSSLSLQGGNLRLEKDTTFNLIISQSASAGAGKNQ